MTLDYELTLKIRNAPLLIAMRDRDIHTAAELSRNTGVSQSDVGQFLNLTCPAYRANGSIRKSAQKLIDFFMCELEDIFPPDHFHNPIEQNAFSAFVSRSQMISIASQSATDPSVLIENLEEKALISEEFLGSLTKREAKVLRMRFGIGTRRHTLEDIGKEFDVTRDRIRQIEQKSIRKLKNRVSAGFFEESRMGDYL